jgi:hypothetical protein
MANPNMTVAKARNRKYSLVVEWTFNWWSQAQDYAEEMRKTGKYAMVRVTGVNTGPRNKPVRRFFVRGYE